MSAGHVAVGGTGGIGITAMLADVIQHFQGVDAAVPNLALSEAGLAVLVGGFLGYTVWQWISRPKGTTVQNFVAQIEPRAAETVLKAEPMFEAIVHAPLADVSEPAAKPAPEPVPVADHVPAADQPVA